MIDKKKYVLGPKSNEIFLGHCSVSPLYHKAADAMASFSKQMSEGGIRALPGYFDVMPTFHRNGAALLHTSEKNISYIHNTAEAMCQIANGYPFEPGDQVISYLHEYPSNHYPWVLQRKRGVELLLLEDSDPLELGEMGKPRAWDMNELVSLVTSKTKVITISHVQFSSGYAANLQELGDFCKQNNIDLIVDCAQSLGCLPVYPEEYNIAAVASSAWKWLMGPKGSAILYTSPQLRQKLEITMAGPGLMRQGLHYLDHSWDPHQDGRMFEYSTLPWDHVAGINAVLEEVFLCNSMEEIRSEIFRLQDLFIENLEPGSLTLLHFAEAHRSGILTALPNCNEGEVPELVNKISDAGVIVTAPVGYLRFAPHFYLEDDQIIKAAEVINAICKS